MTRDDGITPRWTSLFERLPFVRIACLAIAIGLALSACGPIDVPAGQIQDEESGPPVLLTNRSPDARFRFRVVVNQAARINGGQPAFLIGSDELELGKVGPPSLPVNVRVRATGDGATFIALDRGWCRGDRCVGPFEVSFELAPDAAGSVRFNWKIAATVNFLTPEVPEGAAVDVTLV